MELADEILASWDRQVKILENVAGLVTEENRKALPSPDGWPLDRHLCHIQEVRYGSPATSRRRIGRRRTSGASGAPN